MTEHSTMQAYRKSYDTIDIEKTQSDIRVLNSNLMNCLLTLNRVLNLNDHFQAQIKEQAEEILKLQGEKRKLTNFINENGQHLTTAWCDDIEDIMKEPRIVTQGRKNDIRREHEDNSI